MFGKIFEQIYDSSVAEDWTVRVVFQDFVILADINGVVDRTPEAIARRTNVPLEVVKKAIQQLEKPDPRSRSKEEDGARIRRLDEHRDWGWEVINYHKYREIASDEQRREKTRNRTKKWRDSAANNGSVTQCDAPVTLCDAGDAMQKQKQKQRDKDSTCAYHPNSRVALHYLNERAAVHFREVDSNLSIISQRLKEPEVTILGVREMIDRQVLEWKNGPMEKYLRPETLFAKSKFDGYYARRLSAIVAPNNGYAPRKRYVPNI